MNITDIPPGAVERLGQLYDTVLKEQGELSRLLQSLPAKNKQETEAFRLAIRTDNVELLRTWGHGQWPSQPGSPTVSQVVKKVFSEKRVDLQHTVQLYSTCHETIVGFPPESTFKRGMEEYQSRIKVAKLSHPDPNITKLYQLSITIRHAQKRIQRIIEKLDEAGQLDDASCLEKISTLYVATTTGDFGLLQMWGEGKWATDIQCNSGIDFGMSEVYAKIFDFSMKEITSFAGEFAGLYEKLVHPPHQNKLAQAIEHARKHVVQQKAKKAVLDAPRPGAPESHQPGAAKRSPGSSMRDKILAAHQQKAGR